MPENWWKDLLSLTQRHNAEVSSFIGRMATELMAHGVTNAKRAPGEVWMERDVEVFYRVFKPLILKELDRG